MKIISRYFFIEIFKAVSIVLFALLTLYSFFDLLAALKDSSGREHLWRALLIVLLNIPARFYELFPIAILIGNLYALTTLARHSEITVLRASGLKTRQLLMILFRFALLSSVVAMLMGEVLAPYFERLQQRYALEQLQLSTARNFLSGVWLKDGHTFINAARIESNQTISKVRIWQFNDQNELINAISAETATTASVNSWALNNVVRMHFNGDRLERDHLDQLMWHVRIPAYILQMLTLSPERMSMYNLTQYMKHLKNNQQTYNRESIVFWKRLLYPLAALVMAALALPFAYSHHRMSPVSLKIFFGVMIGTLFHMLNGLFSSLGIIHAWPTFISALAPSFLFLCAAISMLWWVERR